MIDLGPKGIGVFNVNGELHALRNQCPHASAPVCRGEVTGTTSSDGPYDMEWIRDGEILRCPWHRWEFEIASGETITEPTYQVQTFEVDVESDIVYVHVPAAYMKRQPSEER